MTVQAERVGRQIEIHFPYNPDHVRLIKGIPGSRFSKTDGPHWTVPLDLGVCRELRQAFESELKLGPELRAWGKQEVSLERGLGVLAAASTAELTLLPTLLPELNEAVHIGPIGVYWAQQAAAGKISPAELASKRKAALAGPGSFQVADVAFGAQSKRYLNGNQPGIGKTLETIGSIFEAGISEGRHLVICPVSSKDSVWQYELERWQPYPVWVAEGSRAKREAILQEFFDETEFGPGWLIINAEMVKVVKDPDEMDDKPKGKMTYPQLEQCVWSSITRDEIHKQGTRNINTQASVGMKRLKSDFRVAISGTPIGGKIINLFGTLQWLRPEVYTSKWKWAERWLEVSHDYMGHKEIGGLVKTRQDDFFKSLVPIMLRRTKAEVLHWLPAKHRIPVWVDFGSPEHQKQYEKFELDAFVKIGEEDISATGVLAEYTRLKQFATALHGPGLVPKPISGKIAALEQILGERGILEPAVPGEEWTGEQVVIFSQFKQVVNMVSAWLDEKEVSHYVITGDTTRKGERKELKDNFQAGKARVMVMTTTAGGVSITLDRASTVVILDETWVDDDQEQAEDRCHRASKTHQVTVYYLRTKGTIEEMIMNLNTDKREVNKLVLDLRRLAAAS